jgi:hypothetical protein
MVNTRGLAGWRGRTRQGPVAGLAAGGVLLAATTFLAGCSGGTSSGTAGGQAVKAAAPAGPAVAAPAGGEAGVSGAGTTARLAPASSIIYTAELTVRAASVSSAATRAAQIAQSAGGYVSSETASADPGHPSRATASVQLKIPVTSYPATLSQLAGRLGSQLSLRQQAQDVTQQVADVTSQVTSDEAAIAQLRALLSHAGSVGDLLSVQNQINAEESSLEQMQAQQRALGHETSYATVTLTILGPAAKPAMHAKTPPQPGRRPSRRLARPADHGVLDAGLPRRGGTVRGRPGRGWVRHLPRQALADPATGNAPGCRVSLAGLTGELGALRDSDAPWSCRSGPEIRLGYGLIRCARGRPAARARWDRSPAGRRARG